MSPELMESLGQIESVFERRVFGSDFDQTIYPEGLSAGAGFNRRKPLQSMGIPPPTGSKATVNIVEQLSSIEMARLVENGMEGNYLKRLSDGIPRDVLAATLGGAKSNFTKYYSRHLSKVQTDEINDLTLIWKELTLFFGGDADMRDEWLKSSTPALSGAQPEELLSTIVGRQVIRKTLDAMRHGEFA